MYADSDDKILKIVDHVSLSQIVVYFEDSKSK